MHARGSKAGGTVQVSRIGWWALVGAVVVHAIVLLGLRVPRAAPAGWLPRRTLVWQTQPQRSRAGGITAARIAGIHRSIPRETPSVATLSVAAMAYARRAPALQAVASVMETERDRAAAPAAGVPSRKVSGLVWHIEAEGDLADAVMRAWQLRGGAAADTAYAPRAPVMVQVEAVRSGAPRSVIIMQSSGDAQFDAAARALAGSLRVVLARTARPDDAGIAAVRRARVVLTVVAAEQ